MPSTSAKQARTMQAAAHNPAFAKKIGIPQSVAREFAAADTKHPKPHHGTHDEPMKTPPRHHDSHDSPMKIRPERGGRGGMDRGSGG